jgi:transposase
MSQRKRPTYTDEFKREAVRLTQTSERTIRQVAEDLGIGFSTLTKWKRKFQEEDLLSGPHDDVTKELARLRKENTYLRQERDLLKKATAFFARETSR